MVAVLFLISTNDYDASYEVLLSWNILLYLNGNDSSHIMTFFSPNSVWEPCVTHRFLSTVLSLAQCYIKGQRRWWPLMWIFPSVYFCPSLFYKLWQEMHKRSFVHGVSDTGSWLSLVTSSSGWSRMRRILTPVWESKTQDYPFKFWGIWDNIFSMQNTPSNRKQFISKMIILKTFWIVSLCIPSNQLTK